MSWFQGWNEIEGTENLRLLVQSLVPLTGLGKVRSGSVARSMRSVLCSVGSVVCSV